MKGLLAEILIRVVSNCLLLAAVLTFLPAFEPERKKLPTRYLYILGRYTIIPGVLLGLVFYFVSVVLGRPPF